MKFALFSIACVIYVAFLGATKANYEECTYVFLHKPVCGTDGKTYINYGHLTCEKLKKPGLRQWREGECPEDGVIIEDGPFGDSGEGHSKHSKIKIHVGHIKSGHHLKSNVKKQIAKAVVHGITKAQGSNFRSRGGSRGGGGGRRGRRSAEENYEYNEDYPEPEYEYIDDVENEDSVNEM